MTLSPNSTLIKTRPAPFSAIEPGDIHMRRGVVFGGPSMPGLSLMMEDYVPDCFGQRWTQSDMSTTPLLRTSRPTLMGNWEMSRAFPHLMKYSAGIPVLPARVLPQS
jgi:hypothetical protein